MAKLNINGHKKETVNENIIGAPKMRNIIRY